MSKLQSSKGSQTDTWLTPPDLIEALGPFKTDPCVHTEMPWSTAELMYDIYDDGLIQAWKGNVWLNMPYSKPLPWVEKFVDHGNGIALVGGRSPDTKWCQLLMSHADLICYPPFRFAFYYPDGTCSYTKWQPSLLVAIGKRNMQRLKRWAKQHDALCFVGEQQ